MKYPSIVQAVFGEPWAIRPETYAVICDLVRFRAEGGKLSEGEIQARIGAGPVRAGAARNGAIAVLPLYGVMAQRMNLMSAMSGGTSTEQFGRAFQAAMSDPGVSAVVMDIDSPGGSVYGVQELWQLVMDARGAKPIVAVANSRAGSAAYYVATAADEIVVTPSGEVGSIGVIGGHVDISKQEEMIGERVTLVSAGKFKAELSPFAPLSDEAREALQGSIDQYYGMFVGAVARGRGARAADVRTGFGQGRMVGAQDAVRLGMADRVATLDQTIARLVGRPPAGARAEGLRVVVPAGANTVAEAIEQGADMIVLAPDDVAAPDNDGLDLRARRLHMGRR